MIPFLSWILAAVFLLLVGLILLTARAGRKATDGGLGVGLVLLLEEGAALLALLAWMVVALWHLVQRAHP